MTRIHERSGWKLDGRKHGLAARFTADGAYVILTPAFRSGGRPTVLRLADAEVLTPRFPARGWWPRLNDEVTVVPSLV